MEAKHSRNNINIFKHSILQIKKTNLTPFISNPDTNTGIYKSKLINEEEIDFEKESDLLGEDFTQFSKLSLRGDKIKNMPYSQPFPSTQSNESLYLNLSKNFIDNSQFTQDKNQYKSKEINQLNYTYNVHIKNLPKILSERKLRELASLYGKVIKVSVKLK